MVRRQVCIQRTRNGGLESHWLAERLAYLGRSWTGGAVWRRKASRSFPPLKSDPKAEGRRKPMGETPFVRECRAALRNLPRFSDLSRPRKELYRELMVGSASDPFSERISSADPFSERISSAVRPVRPNGGRDPLPVELGARIELLGQLT